MTDERHWAKRAKSADRPCVLSRCLGPIGLNGLAHDHHHHHLAAAAAARRTIRSMNCGTVCYLEPGMEWHVSVLLSTKVNGGLAAYRLF